MESAMYHTFWRWEVIARLVKTDEGVIFTLVTDRAEPRVYIPTRAFADQEEMRLFQLECERLANKILEQGEKPKMPPAVRKRDQVRNTRNPFNRTSPLLQSFGKRALLLTTIMILFFNVGMVVVVGALLFMVWKLK